MTMILFGPPDRPDFKIGLLARPLAQAAGVLEFGLVDPSDSAGDDFQPLFHLAAASWNGDDEAALVYAPCIEWHASEGGGEWPIRFSGADGSAEVLGRITEAGLPMLRLCSNGAPSEAWLYRSVGCSPLIGPAVRNHDTADDRFDSPLHEAWHPIAKEALSRVGRIETPLPLLVATNLYTLELSADTPGTNGSSHLSWWSVVTPTSDTMSPEQLAEKNPDGWECAVELMDENDADRGFVLDLQLHLNFAAERGVVMHRRTSETSPDHLDLSSLGVRYMVPPGTSPEAIAAWTQRLEMSPWMGGQLIVDHATIAAANETIQDSITAAGLAITARPHGSDIETSRQHLKLSPEQRLAHVALGGLSTAATSAPHAYYRLRDDSHENGLEALAIGAFMPSFEHELSGTVDDNNDTASLAPIAEGLSGPHADSWKRAAGMRAAFLPYLAHLRCRELIEGRPATQPIGLSPHDWPNAGLDWTPHSMVGDDLLIAGMRRLGGEEKPFYLPGGEWVDFFEGSRFRDVRKFPEERQPPPPGRVLALMRAGVILPLFDLAARAPFATGNPRRPGPSDHLVLKGTPLMQHAQSFYDPYAVAGDRVRVPLAEVPQLRVGYWREEEKLHVEVAGHARRLTVLLRWHRPGRITAATNDQNQSTLVQVENEQQFLVATDCWLYHPARDEVMIRTRLASDAQLHLVLHDMQ